MKAKILVLAVLLGMSVVMFAQPGEGGQNKRDHEKTREHGMSRVDGPHKGLNLTETQKEAFKQSMLAVQKQLQPIRNELGEAVARQKTLTTVEKPDLAAINKNIEKMGALKVEMAKIQVKHHLEMRAQLSDEQRLKFDLFKHQMKDGKGMKGSRGGKGMGRDMKRPMN